jgi:hypothetical protein
MVASYRLTTQFLRPLKPPQLKRRPWIALRENLWATAHPVLALQAIAHTTYQDPPMPPASRERSNLLVEIGVLRLRVQYFDIAARPRRRGTGLVPEDAPPTTSCRKRLLQHITIYDIPWGPTQGAVMVASAQLRAAQDVAVTGDRDERSDPQR